MPLCLLKGEKNFFCLCLHLCKGLLTHIFQIGQVFAYMNAVGFHGCNLALSCAAVAADDMRRPGGAVSPAMNPTTGFFTFALMYSAASSSADPPISPIMTMPLVASSSLKRLRACLKSLFPPFCKGGQGGFPVHPPENPPQSPFKKGEDVRTGTFQTRSEAVRKDIIEFFILL